MLLDIDFASQEPIYRQIRAQIVRAVATGELAPGDALPSVRSLAGDLGVNMHTVNKAYAVLRDEGFIAIRGRSGAYVTERANPAGAEGRIVQALTHAAFEFRAQGGSADEFADLARSAFAQTEGSAR